MAPSEGVFRHPLVNSKSLVSIQEYDSRNDNQAPGEHEGGHHCPENIPRRQHEHIFEERFWRAPEGQQREDNENESGENRYSQKISVAAKRDELVETLVHYVSRVLRLQRRHIAVTSPPKQ